MKIVFQNLFIGSSVATALAGFSALFWLQEKTRHLEPEVRGGLFSRIQEIGGAFLQSIKMKDLYSAKHHAELIATLPSKISPISGNLLEQHFMEIINRSALEPVLPIFIKTPTGFNLVGSSKFFDDPTKKSLLEENYIRCSAALEYRSKTDYMNKDVLLIKGKSDGENLCKEFQTELLKNISALFLKYKSQALTNSLSPYSDTRIFSYTEGNFLYEGVLGDVLYSNVLYKMFEQPWFACSLCCQGYTHLSPRQPKKFGAIVIVSNNVALSHEDVCNKLKNESLQKLLEKTYDD